MYNLGCHMQIMPNVISNVLSGHLWYMFVHDFVVLVVWVMLCSRSHETHTFL